MVNPFRGFIDACRKYMIRGNPARNTFTEDFIRKNNYRLTGGQRKALKKEWTSFVGTIESYPNKFFGRGIVICAGGMSYTTCAWVCISVARKLGCTLPIELWYDGPELNRTLIRQFENLQVNCRNCRDYTKSAIQGFAMKPFAILNSSFREILLLDADNNCTKDPAYLFDNSEYLHHGAVFWPDFWKTSKENPIWKIIGSKQFELPEQESGQIVIDKEKCWKELNLCMYFNYQSQHYYKMLLGDKDTFKFAWLALGRNYYMIPTPPGLCGFSDQGDEFYGLSMVQHDMNGSVLFLHRNLLKWDQTRDDEILWTKIKRRRKTLKPVRFKPKWVVVGDSSQHFVDMEGDVEILSFCDLFDRYEEQCLEFLKELRKSEPYLQFILYLYFLKTRSGYSEDMNLFSEFHYLSHALKTSA